MDETVEEEDEMGESEVLAFFSLFSFSLSANRFLYLDFFSILDISAYSVYLQCRFRVHGRVHTKLEFVINFSCFFSSDRNHRL